MDHAEKRDIVPAKPFWITGFTLLLFGLLFNAGIERWSLPPSLELMLPRFALWLTGALVLVREDVSSGSGPIHIDMFHMPGRFGVQSYKSPNCEFRISLTTWS